MKHNKKHQHQTTKPQQTTKTPVPITSNKQTPKTTQQTTNTQNTKPMTETQQQPNERNKQ